MIERPTKRHHYGAEQQTSMLAQKRPAPKIFPRKSPMFAQHSVLGSRELLDQGLNYLAQSDWAAAKPSRFSAALTKRLIDASGGYVGARIKLSPPQLIEYVETL